MSKVIEQIKRIKRPSWDRLFSSLGGLFCPFLYYKKIKKKKNKIP